MTSYTGDWNWASLHSLPACQKEKKEKEKDKERKGKERKKKRTNIPSFADLSFDSNTAGKRAGGPKYCT